MSGDSLSQRFLLLPRAEDVLRARDELLFAANSSAEDQIRAVVHAAPPHQPFS